MTARAVCRTSKNLYKNLLLPPIVQLGNQNFKEFLLSSSGDDKVEKSNYFYFASTSIKHLNLENLRKIPQNILLQAGALL